MKNFFKPQEWKLLWPFYVSTLIGTLFAFIGTFLDSSNNILSSNQGT